MTSRVQVDGEFNGFEGETIVRLTNGDVWQQAEYWYHYHYAYMPSATLRVASGTTTLQIDGVPQPVPVVPASILVEGTIVSDFNGFNGDAVFEFQDGSRWQQSRYAYSYHYAYRPSAMIVDGISGIVLSVDGMSTTVPVRRIR